MRLFFALRQALGAWLAGTVPHAEPAGDEQRRSVRAVTLEQLGITHWSCHPHL